MPKIGEQAAAVRASVRPLIRPVLAVATVDLFGSRFLTMLVNINTSDRLAKLIRTTGAEIEPRP